MSLQFSTGLGPTRGNETVAASDSVGAAVGSEVAFSLGAPEPALQLDLGSLSTRDYCRRVASDPEHAL
jgi:hypothetical protein